MYVHPLHRLTDRDEGLREQPGDAALAMAALVQDAIDADAKRHR